MRRIFLLFVLMIILYYVSKSVGVREYFPRGAKFSLLLPYLEPKIPLDEKRLFMVVLVNSAASSVKHRLLRTAIRDTWGQISSTRVPPNRIWKLFFVLGVSESVENHAANLQEASHHNDIIIGNFTDHYYNLAIKTFMGHYWAVSRFSCKYVLKTDDDVYVRVPNVIRWLKEERSPRPFYGGLVEKVSLRVAREPTSKWYVTKEQYAKDRWPSFCHGAFHILSTDVIPIMLKSARHKAPPHTDDAYIAVIMNHASVSATQIPGFAILYITTDCDLNTIN
ncbi:hypothetical protein QZH41_000606 [Actinostola sp. cb2023]|nr:hypothetical protein QZH41_000606 [Actinostola sp. cb2023]